MAIVVQVNDVAPGYILFALLVGVVTFLLYGRKEHYATCTCIHISMRNTRRLIP